MRAIEAELLRMGEDRLTIRAIARSRWIEGRSGPGVRVEEADARETGGEAGPPPAWAAEVLQTFHELLGNAHQAERRPIGKEAGMPIRVLIADDHAFIRGLIRGLLAPYSDVQ